MTFDLRQSLSITSILLNAKALEKSPIVLIPEFSSESEIKLSLVSEERTLA